MRAEIARTAEALRLRQQVVAGRPQTADVAYREGEVGIPALLDAVRTASRARVREVEMRLGARLAQVALERAVGDVLWP